MNTSGWVNTDEEDSSPGHSSSLPPSSCHLDCPVPKKEKKKRKRKTAVTVSGFNHAVLYRLSPTEVIMPVITIIKDEAAPLLFCAKKKKKKKEHARIHDDVDR